MADSQFMKDVQASITSMQGKVRNLITAHENADAVAAAAATANLAALQVAFDAYKLSHPDVVTPPPPPPPPVTTEFPDATNTGTKGTLTAYTGPTTITVAGTVIDSKAINSGLVIAASNVVIKNCEISTASWTGIACDQFPVTVQNCELNGLGGTAGSYGINGMGTFTANNIYGWENGISPGSNSIVKGNFIHDLKAAGSDPHYDGIPLHGGQSNVLIEDNTIIGRDNACVFITNDFGAISNVTVNHNKLLGAPGTGPNASLPVYTVYIDGRKSSGGAITAISVTNNIVQKGVYGSIEIDQASVTKSGNVDAVTSQPI